jgi:Flp pilus assembly protein TadD
MIAEAVSMDSNAVAFALPALAEVAGPEFDPTDMMAAPPPPDPDVERIVNRMMQHAPNAPSVHTINIRRALDESDFARADSVARRAIAENPNNAMAHRYLGLLRGRQGRTDEAIASLRAAGRLDPHSPSIGTDLGEMLSAAGRTTDAIQQFERVVREHPDFTPARVGLGLAYQSAGQEERALAQLQRAAVESDHNPMVMGSLGYVYAAQGAIASANAVLDSLRLSPDKRGGTSVAIARVLTGLGQLEQAAQSLQESGDGRARSMSYRVEWLRMDPMLRALFPDTAADSLTARNGRRPQGR